jgi:hypothetical protein
MKSGAQNLASLSSQLIQGNLSATLKKFLLGSYAPFLYDPAKNEDPSASSNKVRS